MLARIRHGTRFEPTVENFRDSGVDFPVFEKLDIVHEMLMEVDRFFGIGVEICAIFFINLREFSVRFVELFHRTDDDNIPILALPNRDRRTPVAVSANIPIASIFKPFPESSVLDIIGRPVHFLIIGNHSVFEGFDIHIPSGNRPINKRCMATVTVRIGVVDGSDMNELFLRFQSIDNNLIEVENIHVVIGEESGRVPDGIDMGDESEFFFLSDLRIIHSVGGSNMHHSRTGIGRDMVSGHDFVRILSEFHIIGKSSCFRKSYRIIEHRFIFYSHETRSGIFANERIILRVFVIGRDSVFCEDIGFARRFVENLSVYEIFPDCESEIRGKRPGSSRPGEDIFTLISFHFELHRYRFILLILIPLIHLEIGERSGTARTVRNHAVRFVYIPLVVDALEHPPNRLHEVGIHGLVIVVHIDPSTHPFDGLPPDIRVLENIRATLFVECEYSDLILDVFFPRNSHLFLDDVLDRKPVAIPPEPSFHELPLHGLVSRYDIFDGSCQEMTVVRSPGRKRRTVIEIELRSTLADFERFLKGIVRFPVGEDFLFESRKWLARVDLWEGHRKKVKKTKITTPNNSKLHIQTLRWVWVYWWRFQSVRLLSMPYTRRKPRISEL
ncbi:MAG: hypothetical protein ACD_78C00231G0002 [uncultured bacterium (gcode 4)]|uniref:Uncharacterized protein n=1 Tax=uncultured bacterium (gcode 4) TaxID=1234023 RepID=K1XY09_9BACT|nr:MAG: hypothetical protein ACD_78C00231G0002 [uncultured bacterium (gcode 4)]